MRERSVYASLISALVFRNSAGKLRVCGGVDS
jgi:hypothetical protein